jgi:ABC-type multidrug transport system fused ATPase/permease subunit
VRANLNPASLEQSSRAGKEKTPSEDEAQLSPITDEAIIEALQKVGLSEQISTKGGLGAAMDEVSLSAGQKQLFSLARAILHQRQTGSKVVLVDEATSSIDHESDAQVQAVMGEVFGECTVVAIAHRVETIQGADVILEVENGRVAVVEDM